jgi:hypothetical protein
MKEKHPKKKRMHDFLQTMLVCSAKCPRLPRMSLRSVLPLLPLAFTPQTVAMMGMSYQIYENVQEICDLIKQPIQCYETVIYIGNVGKQIKRKFIRAPELCDKQFQQLCDEDATDWIFLFPDDEHRLQ